MDTEQPLTIRQCVLDLAARGLSDVEIGEGAGGITPSIIWRLRTGEHADTRWERGEKIRRFHQLICGRQRRQQQKQKTPEADAGIA